MISLWCLSGHMMIKPFRLAVSLEYIGKVQSSAEQISGSAAGTNTQLLPSAVSEATLYLPSTNSNGALL